MSTWTSYKGLDVPSSATGDAGINLTDDLKTLADRAPYQSSADPTVSDNASEDFGVGSQWFNTSTLTMWVCTNIDSMSGDAKWRSIYRRIDNAIVLAPEAGVGGTDNRAIQLDTGGNLRGPYAIDLQRARSSSDQIASGPFSVVLGGVGNSSSGLSSQAMGKGTLASGNCAHAEGYNTTASGYASHAEGGALMASGTASHAEGYDTSAGGYYSHAEGRSTSASGHYAHAEGRFTNAIGPAAHAEGETTFASGGSTHSGGFGSKAHLHSQWARASGLHNGTEVGSAQVTMTVLFGLSTSDAATELTIGGYPPSWASRFNILDGQTLSCFINIVGRKENGGANDHASFLRQVLIRREGSTNALVGSVQTIGTDINPAGWGGRHNHGRRY